MIVKRKLVKWNKKAVAVTVISICAYYSSIFILILLVPSVSSPPIIAFLVFLSFLLLLLFLLMPFEILKTEIEDVVEVEKVFEVSIDRAMRNFGGASVEWNVQERIIITDKGIVLHGYLIGWEDFKSCRVESDRIILKARLLPKIVLPYKEEIYSFIEDKIGNKIRS